MLTRITRYLAGSGLALAVFAISVSGDCTPSDYGSIKTYSGGYNNGSCRYLNPGPYEVVVYQYPQYHQFSYPGYCAVLGPGQYQHSYRFGMDNDSVSSIKVGSNVYATLYSDACFGGRRETFFYNDDGLYNNYIGERSVSSIQVVQYR